VRKFVFPVFVLHNFFHKSLTPISEQWGLLAPVWYRKNLAARFAERFNRGDELLEKPSTPL
jgi:hypothetical protein